VLRYVQGERKVKTILETKPNRTELNYTHPPLRLLGCCIDESVTHFYPLFWAVSMYLCIYIHEFVLNSWRKFWKYRLQLGSSLVHKYIHIIYMYIHLPFPHCWTKSPHLKKGRCIYVYTKILTVIIIRIIYKGNKLHIRYCYLLLSIPCLAEEPSLFYPFILCQISSGGSNWCLRTIMSLYHNVTYPLETYLGADIYS
jgi:hypothetical protein